ncbi:MAG: hypothetical protein UEU88_05160 [Streptococcus salivarius]|nr:hypothetical protein [Streptococcus salivarius]
MNTIERMPRPTGVTILAQQMNKAKSKKLRKQRKEKLISHIVNIYTMSGFRINDRTLSIPQLATLLKTKVETIQSAMLGTSHTLEAFKDPKKLSDTAAALANMSTLWAIQDRGTVQHQLEILMKSQGEKYMPFISGEISRLLSTLLQSNKQVAEIFRTFYQSGSTININNQIQNNNQSQTLTVEEAYKIVQTSQPKEIQTDNIKQAKILDKAQLLQIEQGEDISLDILHRYDHIDNSIASPKNKRRKEIIQDVDWIEEDIPTLQEQLNQEEDPTIRQRLNDRILTLQKALSKKENIEQDQGSDEDQDEEDNLDPDSHESDNPTKQNNSRTSTILFKSNSISNTKESISMSLGNGIPLQDYDSVSDQGCKDGLGSGCKDSQDSVNCGQAHNRRVSNLSGSDSVSDQGPGSGQTGRQFLGMGNGGLRPYDSHGNDSQEGHNAIQHSNPLAQVEAYVKAKMAPQDKPIKAIKRHPKKEKVIHIKHAYGDTVLPTKAKEKKAQRHLNSLARRSLNAAEDDSLPNRD